MENKDIAGMTGQARGEGTTAYKLNEVRMNGDTGEFSMLELLGEKGPDGKYPVKAFGKTLEGVILKMRWRGFKAEGDGDSFRVISTSEWDNKLTDTVVLFGTGEKGIAADLKDKYKLGSQRVLYVFLPGLKQVVRVIVKSSALSGEKNPGEEMGLFEYVDMFNNHALYLHEWTTKFSSVFRTDPTGNKRKDYYAMIFEKGHEITPENKGKIVEMIEEVHGKTTASPDFAKNWTPPNQPRETGVDMGTEEYPQENIDLDSIPF